MPINNALARSRLHERSSVLAAPLMGESMESAGFAIGSSSSQATEDAKALASACPDAYGEMPLFPKFWYTVAVDAIEKDGEEIHS